MFVPSLLLWVGISQAAPLSKLGDITFTEFQADTQTVSQYYGEWFEIYNNSGATQDLNGIEFRHSTDGGTTWQSFRVDRTLLVGQQDYVVFGVSSDLDPLSPSYNGNVAIDYEYKFFDASDPNVGFNLKAEQDWVQVSTATGVLLDEVQWVPAWGFKNHTDAAMQVGRNAFKVEWANDYPVNWCASEVFIPGSGMKGSPGSSNDYCGANPNDDLDGDGYTQAEGDCRDDDPTVNPGQVDSNLDAFYNTDDNCNGTRDDGALDQDGDGFRPMDGDCDDTRVSVHPGAPESLANELDDDCNGCINDQDNDGDGFTDCDTAGDGSPDDCNLNDHTIYPGAPEVPYDGIDQDCDTFDQCDVDSDGFGALEVVDPVMCNVDPVNRQEDCDDYNPNIKPGVEENPTDGVDNDCDGVIDIPDRDGDGYTDSEDCMDIGEKDLDGNKDKAKIYALSQSVHPGATEVCNLVDDDCNGFADDLPECQNAASVATLSGGGICGMAPPTTSPWSLAGLAGLALLFLNRRREE